MLPKRFDLSSWLVSEFISLPVLPLNQISASLALQGGRCPFCIQKQVCQAGVTKLIIREASSSLVSLVSGKI